MTGTFDGSHIYLAFDSAVNPVSGEK